MKKLLIIDGNSILNRAFYGVRLLSTADGLFTNAIYGTATIVARHIESVQPDYFVVAFDRPEPTFRHKSYDDYKSNRHGMPDELAVQLPYVKECLSLMGAHCVEQAGYEADDIIGTYAAHATAAGIQTYIVTGDRDSLQLISDTTTVLLATNSESVTFDRDAFFAKYGVWPEQYVDVKALMGDSSDCIPGVKGIGEKTAFKLIADYGSLDGIYGHINDGTIKGAMQTKLTEGRDSAYMSQYLAKIECAAPLDDLDLTNGYTGYDRAGLRELFRRLEFFALIKKFGLDSADETENPSDAPEVKMAEGMPHGDCALYADADNEKFYFSDGENVYTVSGFDDFSTAVDSCGKLIVYDIKSMRHLFIRNGMTLPRCDDVMLMGYVVSASENDYSLARLITRTLGTEPGDAPSMARNIYLLSRIYREKMEKTDAVDLYEKIELPLADVLFEMEHEGFMVDVPEILKFSDKLLSMQNDLQNRIYLYCGEEFNINSPKQLGTVLFDKLHLPTGKKTKNGYSTNAAELDYLRRFSPVIDDILDYRQVGKLNSTYAEGLVRAADENMRVHTSFKQALTATGRLSSTEPNLQNIPIKTELGREFRRFFKAKNDDYTLIDADYSQIELRLLAALSGDETMIDSFLSGNDIHTATAMRVFGVGADEVTVAMRKKAKVINFGIVYGKGDFSLSNDMNVSIKEAGAYIESYFKTYPRVREYLDKTVENAKRDLYVTTLFGRRRYIPELSATKKLERAAGERIAMNSPIQGTAADIIKLAMVNVSRRLKEENIDARLILQVHDELIIETHKSCCEKAKEILRYEMEHAASLSVPLTVSMAVGQTWYDAN